ncbi:MAG: leucine-rich repeat domain-containing protein, partial [Planctomycetota bacterium]
MSSLKSLSSLRGLVLSSERSVGSTGLAALKELPALEYLDCDMAAIDAGLEHLGQLRNLRWLRLRMGRIRGPGLAHLANLPRLERLSLWGSPLTDMHVRYLEGLTGLRSLTLWGGNAPFTDATLATVGKLASLEEFHLIMVQPDFTDVGIERLRGLKNLKKIEYTGVSVFKINGAGMRHLGSLPSLETLKGVWLFSDGLEALSSCRNLKCLNVRLGRLGERWGGSPADVGHLAVLGSLEELDVSGRGLLDEDLARLASLSRLKRLSVWTGEITERGWASIGELGQLESLNMSAGEITDHSLASVGKLRKLEYLNISGNDKSFLTKRGLNHLNQLTNLQTLDLRISGALLKPITDGTALNLTAIKNLKGISLTNIGLQGSDWA